MDRLYLVRNIDDVHHSNLVEIRLHLAGDDDKNRIIPNNFCFRNVADSVSERSDIIHERHLYIYFL